jgi:RNA polymerase sigma factor (sigma-70 family)
MEEQTILRARNAGGLSCEESFRELYDLYGRSVLSWLLVRMPRDQADDLFQEVWAAFLVRWRVWEFREDLAVPGARPVLSFLFQTASFMWKGHLRKHHPSEPLPEDESGPAVPTHLMEARMELGRCLDLAEKICTPEEIEVLVARLTGLSGAEIAQALGVSEPVVDHRYRDAIARLRGRLQSQGTKP